MLQNNVCHRKKKLQRDRYFLSGKLLISCHVSFSKRQDFVFLFFLNFRISSFGSQVQTEKYGPFSSIFRYYIILGIKIILKGKY